MFNPFMPRDTVSRTANVERTGRHKWVKQSYIYTILRHDIQHMECLLSAYHDSFSEFHLDLSYIVHKYKVAYITYEEYLQA